MKKNCYVYIVVCIWLFIAKSAFAVTEERWTGWETISTVEPIFKEIFQGREVQVGVDVKLNNSNSSPTECANVISVRSKYFPYTDALDNGTRVRIKYNGECSFLDYIFEGGELPEGPEGEWETTAELGAPLIIPMGGINIPIHYKKAVISTVGSQGGMSFDDDNEMVRMEVANAAHLSLPPESLHRAPTLFIALSGFDLNLTGSGIRPWQIDFTKAVAESMSDYEVAIWQVDWQASRPMSKQIQLLEKKVEHYLKKKKYAWDVVLVGHSRGGVFAHHLASKLEGAAKVNGIQTYLLDPTASTSHGDTYPNNKIGNPPSFYGNLYYDNKKFLATNAGDLALSTVSDKAVSGYQMIEKNYNHGTFAGEWVNNDVVAALEEHRLRKPFLSQLDSDINENATCVLDANGKVHSGDCSVKVVSIKMNDFTFGADGVLNLDDGLDVLVYASLGPVNITTVRGIVNHKDGIELSSASFLQGTSAVVNSERASVGYADPISDISLALGDSSVSADVNVLVIGASASIGLGGGHVEIKLGGMKLKLKW